MSIKNIQDYIKNNTVCIREHLDDKELEKIEKLKEESSSVGYVNILSPLTKIDSLEETSIGYVITFAHSSINFKTEGSLLEYLLEKAVVVELKQPVLLTLDETLSEKENFKKIMDDITDKTFLINTPRGTFGIDILEGTFPNLESNGVGIKARNYVPPSSKFKIKFNKYSNITSKSLNRFIEVVNKYCSEIISIDSNFSINNF
jgi:hypothetical protein